MSDKLLTCYNRELAYIRSLAAEFARAHPATAQRLGITAEQARDPHVERLIEAFAYLTGRIRRKLDDDFPEVINGLMGVLYPHYQAPIPSMAIVQMTTSSKQADSAEGIAIPAGAEIEAPIATAGMAGEKCLFRTCYPVTVWPIEVSAARLGALPPTSAALRAAHATAALQLTLRCLSKEVTFGKLALRTLRFFLNGQDPHTRQLYELIFNNSVEVILKRSSNDPDPVRLGKPALREVGFGRNEGLLPYPSRTFPGYRLLTDYFVFPQKFMFFEIELNEGQLDQAGGQIELLIGLNRTAAELEKAVSAASVRLGCTPIVNLFRKRADHIELDETKTEYRIVADRRRPLAHEVYSIDQVMVMHPGGKPMPCRPFYSYNHRTPADGAELFWHSRRRPPRTGADTDGGTEVYLSLTDLGFEPASPGGRTMAVDATCLNRDLPQSLPWGGGQPRMTLAAGGPVNLECLTQPTPTLRPAGERGAMWKLISHLSLNQLSLEGPEAAEALREMLRLYDFADSADSRSRIDGILDLTSRRITGRAGGLAAGGVCRGVEVAMRFDEERFFDRGLFLFASVLDRFFGMYCSVNSFVQLVATTKQREGVFRKFARRTGEHVLL
jgi:type VI secretion system protein ImpG